MAQKRMTVKKARPHPDTNVSGCGRAHYYLLPKLLWLERTRMQSVSAILAKVARDIIFII